MTAFDKIIGYSPIKNELIKICDMIKNFKPYKKLGAKMPHGVLLYGKPGLGKTLMAKCFIEETGLNCYTIRKNKSTIDFIDSIAKTFEEAKQNAPSIVFIDDMDKFSNEDYDHKNAEEYVAIQSCIDNINNSNVFVIATANDIDMLPMSLIRNGRFDQKLLFSVPEEKDKKNIVAYYLSDKKIAKNVNINDVVNMVFYNSCAELESIINESAIIAGFNKKEQIEMDDITKSVLKYKYQVDESPIALNKEEIRKVALHEAGHLVVSEVLNPCSVGLASIKSSENHNTSGFIHICKDINKRPYTILVSLAGKVAVELYYSETCASGCAEDLDKAMTQILSAIIESGTLGTDLLYSYDYRLNGKPSEELKNKIEIAQRCELKRYMFKTRDILLKNREFLESIASALENNYTLLYSQIQQIKSNCKITTVSMY